jgi:fructose-specific phosphotransferase system component IIB
MDHSACTSCAQGTGETSLAQRALNALGGQRMGGNVKSDPVQGPLGWQVTLCMANIFSTISKNR